MKVLVTGAAGYVGRWACDALVARGHEVVRGLRSAALDDVGPGRAVRLDLDDDESVREALRDEPDAVVHLAAMASGARARREPIEAWRVNTLGTVRLATAIMAVSPGTRCIFASTGEVYGRGSGRPSVEGDPSVPLSPYAASKRAAEIALEEIAGRTGFQMLIARCFAQTGPGQTRDYVVPAMAARLLEAQAEGRETVPVGNLEPIREFVDVRDVATALVTLVERPDCAGIINVAAGRGISLADLFARLVDGIGWRGTAVPDPSLMRAADIPYLVGDGSRLASLGWRPQFTFDQTLSAVLADQRALLALQTSARSGS